MAELHDILPTVAAALAAAGGVILVLAALLIAAKEKLMPSSAVRIVVNGDEENPMEAMPGSTLLSALAERSVFLPAACGGGGICAMCRCQVVSGGGEILPTETNHLSRREAGQQWRLACQVKVREDMEIRVPEAVLGVRKRTCEVVSNRNVATFIKELAVRLPEGEELEFEAGAYVQVDAPACEVFYKDIEVGVEFRDEWDKFGMWGLHMVSREPAFRAYSMANHPAEGNIIRLNVRIATPPWDRAKRGWAAVNPGVVSSYLFARKPGDKLTMSGPYGDFFIKNTNREMIYIGGGAGMAPLRSHIFHLFHTLKTQRKVSYWYGGRSLRELFYTEDFRAIERQAPNFRYRVALSEPLKEDAWDGPTGFIHQVLYDEYLGQHPEPEEAEYYLCGPPMMLQASLKLLDDLGVPRSHIAYDDFGS